MYVLAHLLFAESGINSDFHLIVKRLQQCPQQPNAVHLLEFPLQKEKRERGTAKCVRYVIRLL
jgi:hypothetical protein